MAKSDVLPKNRRAIEAPISKTGKRNNATLKEYQYK
jgi:hypothetical protein